MFRNVCNYMVLFSLSLPMCAAGDITFHIVDQDGIPLSGVTVEVRETRIQGAWSALQGIAARKYRLDADKQLSVPIKEDIYSMSFRFLKEGYFFAPKDIILFQKDKKKDIHERIILRIKKEPSNIKVIKISLLWDMSGCGKTTSILSTGEQDKIGSHFIFDGKRDDSGKLQMAPVSAFDSSKNWPQKMILKSRKFGYAQFLPCKNLILDMPVAPDSGYADFLEVDPRESEFRFYILLNGYYGKGRIEQLLLDGDKWKIRIRLFMNTQRGSKDLQCDFDDRKFNKW